MQRHLQSVVRWAILLGVAATLAAAHASKIDAPMMERKLAHHAGALANTEPDPYQYKFWIISWAIEGLHRATGIGLARLYVLNTWLSVLALVVAHDAWLRRLHGPWAALLGTLFLAALAHGMFGLYHHHPYEFWGVALFCWLLKAVAEERGVWKVASLCLATGLVWEKHALVPLLAGARKWRRGGPFVKTAAWTALTFMAAIAVPVAVRLICGTDREVVDVTPLSNQRWRLVAYAMLPFVVPPLLALLAAWSRLPDWVRWLWWYVPVLYLAYALDKHFLYELRCFWAFVPIFTATVAGWAGSLSSREPAASAP